MVKQKDRSQSRDEDRKRILDGLKIGKALFDPDTGTKYECIGKLSNGKSITIARSLNVETI